MCAGFQVGEFFVCGITVLVSRPMGERSYGKPVFGSDTVIEGICLEERLEFVFHIFLFNICLYNNVLRRSPKHG